MQALVSMLQDHANQRSAIIRRNVHAWEIQAKFHITRAQNTRLRIDVRRNALKEYDEKETALVDHVCGPLQEFEIKKR